MIGGHGPVPPLDPPMVLQSQKYATGLYKQRNITAKSCQNRRTQRKHGYTVQYGNKTAVRSNREAHREV